MLRALSVVFLLVFVLTENRHWSRLLGLTIGGEFFRGKFESLGNELLIKQEFTPAYSPQYNGVAERGLGIIEAAAMAARIEARAVAED